LIKGLEHGKGNNMKYITRDKSIITGKNNLESLYTFKNFPVFFGCVDHNPSEDIKADMSWAICPESGVIQLNKLVPLEILYQEQHVDGTGPTWQQYYEDFAQYILKQNPINVLEIGGGAGKLADLVVNGSDKVFWTMAEPNPLHEESEKIKIIPKFFDENFKYEKSTDAIVFSQVMEHAYDPNIFLASIANFLKPGGKVIFAYPNLELWLKNKFTNAINFEHTFFLTDYFVDYLLGKNGFSIINKEFYKDHSVFYVAERSSITHDVSFDNKYDDYKQIFSEFIDYYKSLVFDLNTKVANFEGDVYLFGAHIFAQYLFEFGLNKERIVSILDNSSLKIGKRLYGTNFMVENPGVISGKNKVAVILKVGIYRDEILKQLKAINPSVEIFE
jgi:2-polyprenyl-3-methyl-5-hydroxy-6-metoxy-1,4-benzoquinol methylase